MKHGILLPLLLLFQLPVFAAPEPEGTIPESAGRCFGHVPPAAEPSAVPIEQQPIIISAQKAQATEQQSASFSGGVSLEQGDKQLTADSITVNSQTEKMVASGGISYRDSTVSVTAESLTSDINNYDSELREAQYQLHGFNGRGEAESLQIKDQQQVILTETTYTACPPGDNSWGVRAETIEIDNSGEWAEAYHATVELYDVPILYLPYFTYPISNKRKSGFLFPSIGSSSTHGIDISTPYYLNLDPQYDATVTPRVMFKRGVQLQTEFRYMGEGEEGSLNLEFLPEDRMVDDKRWMGHWKHQGSYQRHWRVNAEYTRVGDVNYFNDLGSNINSTTDNQLLQSGQVAYLDNYWELSLEVRDFQVLADADTQPYTMLPSLQYRVNYPLIDSSLYFTLNSELTNFDNSDPSLTTAQRLHVEPGLVMPWVTPQGFMTTELKLIQTNYNQDVSVEQQDTYDDKVNRTLPEFRVHAGLNFDRFTSIFGQQYIQTLEPQFQYLYIPYKDQSNIGIYDTASLQQDYYGLFRDRSFSGLDRIADANQVSLGLTSRYLDEANHERLRFAIGQNFYLESSKVTLQSTPEVIDEPKRSSVAMELDLNFDDSWYFHVGTEYEIQNERVPKGNVALEYRPEPGKVAQLNYRYAYNELESYQVEQLGSKLSWPLTDNYQLVTSYYRDLKLNRSVETYAGIQYESCCWAMRFIYDRHLNTQYEEQGSIAELDTSVKLKFELKGFGSVDTIKDSKMLDGGRFTYGQPFYLSQ